MIKIGDKNKIKDSIIGHHNNSISITETKKKSSFATNHPIITSAVVSLFVGFILLFNFWEKVIDWIERIF